MSTYIDFAVPPIPGVPSKELPWAVMWSSLGPPPAIPACSSGPTAISPGHATTRLSIRCRRAPRVVRAQPDGSRRPAWEHAIMSRTAIAEDDDPLRGRAAAPGRTLRSGAGTRRAGRGLTWKQIADALRQPTGKVRARYAGHARRLREDRVAAGCASQRRCSSRRGVPVAGPRNHRRRRSASPKSSRSW